MSNNVRDKKRLKNLQRNVTTTRAVDKKFEYMFELLDLCDSVNIETNNCPEDSVKFKHRIFITLEKKVRQNVLAVYRMECNITHDDGGRVKQQSYLKYTHHYITPNANKKTREDTYPMSNKYAVNWMQEPYEDVVIKNLHYLVFEQWHANPAMLPHNQIPKTHHAKFWEDCRDSQRTDTHLSGYGAAYYNQKWDCGYFDECVVVPYHTRLNYLGAKLTDDCEMSIAEIRRLDFAIGLDDIEYNCYPVLYTKFAKKYVNKDANGLYYIKLEEDQEEDYLRWVGVQQRKYDYLTEMVGYNEGYKRDVQQLKCSQILLDDPDDIEKMLGELDRFMDTHNGKVECIDNKKDRTYICSVRKNLTWVITLEHKNGMLFVDFQKNYGILSRKKTDVNVIRKQSVTQVLSHRGCVHGISAVTDNMLLTLYNNSYVDAYLHTLAELNIPSS